MKISTHGYAAALRAIAAGAWDDTAPVVPTAQDTLYETTAPLAPEALTRLLEWIVVHNNPIYCHSDKLQRMALELRSHAVHARNRRMLAQYLQTNDNLYLEGYARFRMYDYSQQLDTLMFRIVKHLKLAES